MAGRFSEIHPEAIKQNVFKLIGTNWMLLTAGDSFNNNTMTSSWGGMGHLWNKYVSFVYIRPERYTFEFMEKSQFYTLSFLDETYKGAMEYCGTHSGREGDKIAHVGLTRKISPVGSVYFDEARLVLICKKIYFQDLDPKHFLDFDIAPNYTDENYHRMYIGEILQCLIRTGEGK